MYRWTYRCMDGHTDQFPHVFKRTSSLPVLSPKEGSVPKMRAAWDCIFSPSSLQLARRTCWAGWNSSKKSSLKAWRYKQSKSTVWFSAYDFKGNQTKYVNPPTLNKTGGMRSLVEHGGTIILASRYQDDIVLVSFFNTDSGTSRSRLFSVPVSRPSVLSFQCFHFSERSMRVILTYFMGIWSLKIMKKIWSSKIHEKKIFYSMKYVFLIAKNCDNIFFQTIIFFNNTILIWSSDNFFSRKRYFNSQKKISYEFFSSKKNFWSTNIILA